MLKKKDARLRKFPHDLPEFEDVPAPLPILSADTRSGWRHRARMVVGGPRPQGGVELGFYRAGSRDLLPIAHCLAHHPLLEEALDVVREHASAALIKDMVFVDGRIGDEAREGGACVVLTLCMNDQIGQREAWREGAAALQQLAAARLGPAASVGVHLDVGTRGAAIMSGEWEEVAGPSLLALKNEHWGEVSIPPKAFFQVNPPQLTRVHALMREWLGKTEQARVVLDLYCGVGVHGLALARQQDRVVGVDSSEEAIAAARASAPSHHFFAAHDAQMMQQLDEVLAPEEPIFCVMNPARAGLHRDVVTWLGERRAQVEGIFYLSCEPLTLRRDLVRLRQNGFRIKRWQAIDMMPNTEQVETLVELEACEPLACEEHVERAHGEELGDELRHLSPGVSGVKFERGGEAEWFALVAGHAPRHGELPHLRDEPQAARAQIEVTRLEDVGGMSFVHIRTRGLWDDESLRQRLRAWGHAALGDERFGKRGDNRRFARGLGLDRVALHCVRDRVRGEQAISSELLLLCAPYLSAEQLDALRTWDLS